MVVENLIVKELMRHPLHEDFNIERDLKTLMGLEESTNRYGKVSPVLVINVKVDDELIPHVVDGWSSVIVARNSGQETLPCILIDSCPEDELPNLVASIHANYHNDPEEDYKRFKYFFNRFAKGQGFRSDLLPSVKSKNDKDGK